MPDPLYSSRYTQLFPIIPGATLQVAGPKQSDGKPLGYCSGFVADTSGTIVCIAKDGPGTAPVTLAVTAGFPYPIALRQVISVSPGTMGLVGFL